jgi:hypothetical protein
VNAQLQFVVHCAGDYQAAGFNRSMQNGGKALMSGTQAGQPAPTPSKVFGESYQPFRVGDASALKEDNVLISETPQPDEPGRAANTVLAANPRLGVIFQNYHGCLVLGQGHGSCQDGVVILLV